MTTGLRAVMVCVDYSDYLSITLPYNRHHFDSVMVITSREDITTQSLALENGCRLYVTDAFYRNGATFNKWLAMEEGLDVFGREGWLCLMDADVLWPKEVKPCTCPCHSPGNGFAMMHIRACCEIGEALVKGNIYSPLRHMMENLPVTPCKECAGSGDTERVIGEDGYGTVTIETSCKACDGRGDTLILPSESDWSKYPIHRNRAEWAGYTQIFHAESCRDVLGEPPWHQTDWKHAGGADSFFQAKWPNDRKVRTPWNVLHLGSAGQNWYGRATPHLDGTMPEGWEQKLESCRAIWRHRHARRIQGLDPYADERIK